MKKKHEKQLAYFYVPAIYRAKKKSPEHEKQLAYFYVPVIYRAKKNPEHEK